MPPKSVFQNLEVHMGLHKKPLGKDLEKECPPWKWQGALARIDLLFRKYFKRVGFLQSPVIWYHKTIKVSWKDHVGSKSLNDPKKPSLLQFMSQMILSTWSDLTMSNHILTLSDYIPMILIHQILLQLWLYRRVELFLNEAISANLT